MTPDEVEGEARAAGPRFGQIPGASHVGSSSWQSLARGHGDIENDVLNGLVVDDFAAMANWRRRGVGATWTVLTPGSGGRR